MPNCSYGDLYKRVRIAVMDRYAWRCSGCGRGFNLHGHSLPEGEAIDAHHRDHPAWYPCGADGACSCGNRKVKDTDLIPMCRSCHEAIGRHRRKLFSDEADHDWAELEKARDAAMALEGPPTREGAARSRAWYAYGRRSVQKTLLMRQREKEGASSHERAPALCPRLPAAVPRHDGEDGPDGARRIR